MTVYDGDATNEYVPIYGWYADAYNKMEMIMPADVLSEMEGGTITKMTWYLPTPATDVWGGNFQVYLMEVDASAPSGTFTDLSSATLVFESPLDGTGETLEIAFESDFTYYGGNLLIAVYQTETGSYKRAYFAGTTVDGAAISNYSYSSLEAITTGTVRNFLPKTDFEYIPTSTVVYYKPKNLTVGNITTTSATLNWEAGNDETSWNIQYKAAGDEEWIPAGVASTTSFVLEGLDSGTLYDVQVQSDYGSGNLSGWTSASFATLACDPEDMGEIAYTLTDTYGDGWNGCKLQIFLHGTDIKVAELTLTSGNLLEGTLPLCYDVDYDLVWVAGSYAYETGFVLTGPEGETIYEYQGEGNSSNPTPTAGVLTTFRIHLATCSRPSEVVASNITYNSATITWTPGAEDQDQWQVAYGVGVVNPDSEGVTIETTNEPTITLSLVENTTYSVYVRSVCSESDMSSWSNLCTFATPMQFPIPTALTINDITAVSAKANWQGEATAFNLRYRVKGGNPLLFFESFEDDFTGEDWGAVSNDDDDDTWGIMPIANYTMSGEPLFAADGGSCMASCSVDDEYNYIVADNWLITPQVDLMGTLEFYVADLGEDYVETFSVYVAIGEPTTIDDFTALAEGLTTPGAVPTSPDAWAKHTFDLSDYNGQQGRIAIRHQSSGEGGYYLFVDAITVKDNTIIPTGEWVTMENVISPAKMEGLIPVTTYEAQVQAVYADGVSNWTDMVEFTTLRADAMITSFEVTNIKATAATVNVEGSQATYNIRYRKASTGFFEDFEGIAANGDSAPEGWTTIDADGDGYDWFAWFPSQVGNSETDNNGNPTVLDHVCMTSASYVSYVALTPDNWLITPQVELGGTLSLWYRGQDPAYAEEHFAVYVSTAGNTSTDDFVQLSPETVAGTVYAELTADLSAYEGQMGYIAIRHYNVTDMFRLNIDDVAIIKEGQEAGEWITVEGVTVPYTITGLDPETKYEVQVQGVIDDETTTEWTNIISFYTKPVVSQTIALAEGWNWVSFNVEIAMADLQAALVTAYPSAAVNELVVKAKYVGGGGQTAYNPNAHRWIGSLTTLDLSLMYMVKVPAAGEIAVEGMAIDPADYPLTIAPGANWIAFPLSEGMSIADAFAGFPTSGDIVKTKVGQAQWNSNAGRWIGGIANTPLQPGQGYIYNSKATETRTFTYPTAANVVPSKANNNTGFVASQKLKPEPLDMKLAPQAPHRSLKDIINRK